MRSYDLVCYMFVCLFVDGKGGGWLAKGKFTVALLPR